MAYVTSRVVGPIGDLIPTTDWSCAMSDPIRPAPHRSPATLAGDAIKQGSNLIQKEVELAKAEMSEKLGQLKLAIGEIIGGTVMLIVSLGILLSALVSGVARLLVGLFGADIADDQVVVDGLNPEQAGIVTAVTDGLDASLDAARTLPTYEGLAALLVGTLFAVIGAVLLKNGLAKLDADNLIPNRTIKQVQKDGEMVREKT